jgi:hypothetical protein
VFLVERIPILAVSNIDCVLSKLGKTFLQECDSFLIPFVRGGKIIFFLRLLVLKSSRKLGPNLKLSLK